MHFRQRKINIFKCFLNKNFLKVLVFLLFFNLVGVSLGEELGLVEETEEEQIKEKEGEVEIIEKEPIEIEIDEKKEEEEKEDKIEIKIKSEKEELVVPEKVSLVEEEKEDEKCTIKNRKGLEKVYLNEILPDPTGTSDEKKQKERIELYNSGDEDVNIGGCFLMDKNLYDKLEFDEDLKFKENEKIEGGRYKIVFNRLGSDIKKSFDMNKSDEEIYFLDENGEVINKISYKISQPDFSLALNPKGEWRWTEFVTFGEENKFPEPKIYSKKLEMTELMPNPEGIDEDNEWVELFNNDSEKINLEGWFLFNQAGKEFELTDLNEIDSQKRLLAEIKNTSFSLRNSEGWVELRDPSGEVVDKISYIQSIKENVSLNKNSAGQWLESIFSTPGEENRFNHPPTYKVDLPEEVYKDVKAEFEIKNAKDQDGEKLKYRWDFGDGKKSYLEETTHIFSQKGKYIIQVRVGDASIDIFKNYEIMVKRFPQLKLRIVKLVPNPEGSDSKNEKIWIENLEKKSVNLKGWIVATGASTEKLVNHYIKDDFKIKAGEVKALEREDCPFSLLNKKGQVVLKSPNGKEVDKVKYEKDEIIEDEIYYWNNGEWLWETPFQEEKEPEPFILGETSSNQTENWAGNLFSMNKVLGNSRLNKTDRFKAVFFENWLFAQSQKTFFKFIFPQSYWGKF